MGCVYICLSLGSDQAVGSLLSFYLQSASPLAHNYDILTALQ